MKLYANKYVNADDLINNNYNKLDNVVKLLDMCIGELNDIEEGEGIAYVMDKALEASSMLGGTHKVLDRLKKDIEDLELLYEDR